MTMLRERR